MKLSDMGFLHFISVVSFFQMRTLDGDYTPSGERIPESGGTLSRRGAGTISWSYRERMISTRHWHVPCI